jgi:hypothetical protein
LWKGTKIGDVLPWEDVADEAERLLSIITVRDSTQESHNDREQEDDQEKKGDD